MPDLLQSLARGERFAPRVVIVAAHPDDESLALGSRLDRFDDLCILHLTDGAPRDLADARRSGCADAASYAALRRDELTSALDALGADPERTSYGHPDQEAILDCPAIVSRLMEDLAGAAAVVTHAYEHGHPDHDTAALAVRLACDRLQAGGRLAPAAYEFPSYHMRDSRQILGAFWPDPRIPETVLTLSDRQRARKRSAIACFASQAKVLAQFPQGDERLRPAPAYDFGAPAPPGAVWYDPLGWEMTSAVWRRHADAVLDGEPAWA